MQKVRYNNESAKMFLVKQFIIDAIANSTCREAVDPDFVEEYLLDKNLLFVDLYMTDPKDVNSVIGCAMVRSPVEGQNIYPELLLLCSAKRGHGAKILVDVEDYVSEYSEHLMLESTAHAVGFYLNQGYIFCNAQGAPVMDDILDNVEYEPYYKFRQIDYDIISDTVVKYNNATPLQLKLLSLVPFNNNGRDLTEGSWNKDNQTFRMVKNLITASPFTPVAQVAPTINKQPHAQTPMTQVQRQWHMVFQSNGYDPAKIDELMRYLFAQGA